MGGTRRHHAHTLAGGKHAVDDAHVRDDAPVGVVDGIEDHGARRRIGFSRGGGDDLDNAVKEGFDALTGLAGDLQDFVFVAAN